MRSSDVGGHEGRLELILKECEPEIRAYVLRRVNPLVDVDDIVSETFADALEDGAKLLATDKPVAWLVTIAYRRGKDAERKVARRLRAETRFVSRERGTYEDNVVDRLESNTRLKETLEALNLLRETDRELILLAIQDELSHEDIATIKGWSVSKVQQHLHRARSRLKAKLREVQISQEGEKRSKR